MSKCLTLAEFERLSSGQLEEREEGTLRTHLETCETCRIAFQQYQRSQSSATFGDMPTETITTPPQPNVVDDTSPAAKIAKHFPKIEGYRIVGIIGQGGMGIVYRAVQTRLNRTVALKVLPAIVGTASPSAVSRFRREARAAARLHHTNIVPIYDFGESRDAYYCAMELIIGQPLNVLVRRFAEQSIGQVGPTRLAGALHTAMTDSREAAAVVVLEPGSVDEPPSSITSSSTGHGRPYYQQVARWMADAADALHYAHGEGIVHRDVKPANLILSTDGRIMVADFGLAKVVDDESLTLTGSFLGTLRYISPEQAMAKRVRVDHRTDIYSLGATMYELLCFQPAFPGDDDKEVLGAIIARDPAGPRKIDHHVPPELETICLKTLEKSPDARYATARALAEDLRCYIHDLPIRATRPGLVRRLFKFTRRHKAAVIAVVAVVLLVGTGTFSVRQWSHRRDADINAAIESGIS
ncbi:MAG: serine/threonine protein kinase [Planctomycetes bacterium]|nr:serine/threonine protein kinase [Planctomycetota bacterium]